MAKFEIPAISFFPNYLGCVMTTPIFLLISPRLTRHMKARSEERSSIMCATSSSAASASSRLCYVIRVGWLGFQLKSAEVLAYSALYSYITAEAKIELT